MSTLSKSSSVMVPLQKYPQELQPLLRSTSPPKRTARPDPGSNLELDMLQNNNTIEIPLLDRVHAYQSVSQSNGSLSLSD